MGAKGNGYQEERIWYLDYGDLRFQSFAIALNAKGSHFSISPVWPNGEKRRVYVKLEVLLTGDM
jgi:hypothetical protein